MENSAQGSTLSSSTTVQPETPPLTLPLQLRRAASEGGVDLHSVIRTLLLASQLLDTNLLKAFAAQNLHSLAALFRPHSNIRKTRINEVLQVISRKTLVA